VQDKAVVEQLSAEEIEDVLKRLAPIQSSEDDVKGFAMREKSLKAPKPGQFSE
jgi:hypothetical protein